jgi:Cu-Zn family superoxide dismutase
VRGRALVLALGRWAAYHARMMKIAAIAMGALVAAAAGSAAAAKAPKPVKVTVDLIDVSGVGKPAGTITIKETAEGLELDTKLKGLPPGEHGFHLHENGSCAPADKEGKPTAGQAAGGHFDPDATKAHKGPGGGGHKGDLPKLEVDPKGVANAKLKVAGLKLADVEGKALMIHEGGDNYSDQPKPLGGGGARIACGVIPGGAAPAEKKAAAPAPAEKPPAEKPAAAPAEKK